MIASAQANERVGMRALDLQEDYMNWSREFYEELKPQLSRIAEQEYDIAAANKQRADEYANYERDTYRPVEKGIVADALAYNTDAKREQLATQASGDVSQAFGVARDQAARQFQGQGINPNSGRFAALNNQLNIQEALARAGAQTNARNQAEDLGYARRLDAAGLGRNLAPNASTAYGVSLNASNQGSSTSMTPGNFMNSAYGQGSNMLGQATNAYSAAGNTYGQEFNARMQGYNAQQQSKAALYSGIGQMAGRLGAAYMTGGTSLAAGMADGGEIRGLRMAGGGRVSGPGGPVDDKIPAMLSDGEYVLPADTVDKVGVKKLDRLVKETHTPAAVQRARKRGLKGKKK
jgi:hypothetical protein